MFFCVLFVRTGTLARHQSSHHHTIHEIGHDAMSIPLPHVPGVSNHFLDPEERYAIFEIKAAERPHLVGVECVEHSDDDDTTTIRNHPCWTAAIFPHGDKRV